MKANFIEKINTQSILNIIKIAGIAAAVFLGYKFLKNKGVFLSSLEKEGEKNLGDMISGGVLKEMQKSATKTDAELRQIASQIKNSFGVFNDDEKQIYEAFRKINNISDLLLVIRYFGVYTRFGKSYGLEDCIAQYLNPKERGKINEILNQKNIDFNF